MNVEDIRMDYWMELGEFSNNQGKYTKDISIKENIMGMDYIYLEIKSYNG